ncbi:MAG: ribose-phosphate pyrophosphokinase [Cytophagales bacterium]|nr:ribose-phosphate pyrophosphokinase [Cytophagales bacterium]
MKKIVFALPGNEKMALQVAGHINADIGEAVFRKFPDGESYLRIISDVKDKCVVLICTLHDPDEKLLPLYFLSQTAKSLGACCTCLVAPYLAYMRQDKVFNPGEGLTSSYFGHLVSSFADSLITIDPHLHRISTLSSIYTIPSDVIHASDAISVWIKNNIPKPVLIGPDSESEQWVSEVAKNANAPFIVLEKTRHGDKNVEVSVPRVDKYIAHTPVLVDDIISSARTMIETIRHLLKAEMKAPVCIGIHAVFSKSAFQDLLSSGAAQVITCNTIPHETNQIDLSSLIAERINKIMKHR